MELEVVTAPNVALSPPERTYLDALRRSEKPARARLVIDAPCDRGPFTARLELEVTRSRLTDAILDAVEPLG